MSDYPDITPGSILAEKVRKEHQQWKQESSFVPAHGSREADPLVSELRSLATSNYPLCPEARLMLEMAVDAQLGKPIDVNRLLSNGPDQGRRA